MLDVSHYSYYHHFHHIRRTHRHHHQCTCSNIIIRIKIIFSIITMVDNHWDTLMVIMVCLAKFSRSKVSAIPSFVYSSSDNGHYYHHHRHHHHHHHIQALIMAIIQSHPDKNNHQQVQNYASSSPWYGPLKMHPSPQTGIHHISHTGHQS